MDALNRRAIVGRGTPEAAWQTWLRRHPLRAASAAGLVRAGAALHVVAPHPDDEILGCAGIMRQVSRLGIAVQVWAVTDGEASHPGSPRWPADSLARARTRESEQALRRLGIDARRERLGLPDGGVATHETELAATLGARLQPGDTVIAPWRLDGHPDHEAVARACLRASKIRACRLLEVPIWGWHWAEPANGGFPWRRAAAIALDAADRQAKADAIQAFRSQLEPDADTGNPPILPDFALARLQRTFEVVLQ
ncbi:1D-myo-inositol 2-acetamido-2-deoxy-alpha-D-glucopyranoside deacetylase [Pigmentiphaga humi]|uniref:1D-myo-inositol 2-acetamido-2-deoxy-alpha-D-glucopyranoside deacetylase n=1 Tax=Pigmentiphaga humi TaxID=2478468 RepID=A0A3P4B429_9BURK|nr:PIG-L family deacetylase [Pigmentiphaga humi]VCU70440.1 1D-myo-inositol 2-acetamido-2-deoxy-alpha-D-glucopyranoside deacetylase [Pigmentiphaga humi]